MNCINLINKIEEIHRDLRDVMDENSLDIEYYHAAGEYTTKLEDLVRELHYKICEGEIGIFEQAILDFVDSCDNKIATFNEILDAVIPHHGLNERRVVERMIDRFINDGVLVKVIYIGNGVYTYELM